MAFRCFGYRNGAYRCHMSLAAQTSVSPTPSSRSLTVLGRPIGFWTRFALLWLMAITVTGAAVRLTGSGLGCTDWPTCSVNEELDAPAFHGTIEFGNRVISGLAIIPVVAAWVIARRSRPDLKVTIIGLVLGFIGQVVLGMLVTRTELDPRVVLGHFLLSIVLIFLGVVLDYRARHATAGKVALSAEQKSERKHSYLVVAAATIVIFVGTLVTGSGPHTGSEASGEPIPRLGFDIFEITRIHSVLAWVLVASIVAGLWRNRPGQPSSPTSTAAYTWYMRIGALAVLQGAIGYLQFFTGVPVELVALHIAGSVALWTAASWYALRTTFPPADDHAPERAVEVGP